MKYKLSESAGVARLLLTGDLTGDLSELFGEVVGSFEGSDLVIEFEGVQHINSLGVKSWQGLLRNLGAVGSYRFVKCPVVFIDYANIVPQILGDGIVESLYVPYQCAVCRKSAEILMTVTEARAALISSAKPVCRSCGGEQHPELSLEDYLAQLNEQQ